MSIRSISIPCMTKNLGEFDRLLSWWEDDRAFPMAEDDDNGMDEPVALMVVLNRGTEDEMLRFHAVWQEHKLLHRVFSKFHVFQADLSGDRDLYVRDSAEPMGKFGNKAGPNLLFLESMRLARVFGGHTFQNEVDCYPIKPGWLTELIQVVRDREFAWVIGSMYTGQHPVRREIQSHLNGNAIYKVGDSAFNLFLDDVWSARLQEFVPINPNLAYDCWWATELARASSSLRNSSWELVSRYEQFFCTCQFLVNTLHPETVLADIEFACLAAADSGIPPLFIHGHSVTKLLESFIASPERDFITFCSRLRENELEQLEDHHLDSSTLELLIDAGDLDPEPEIISMFKSGFPPYPTIPDLNHGVVSIASLPARVGVMNLPESSFVGNWCKRDSSDHVWAGDGTSAITLRFPPDIAAVQVRIRGDYANIDPQPSVLFQAFGAQNIQVAEERSGEFVISATDPESISQLAILLYVDGAGKVGLDARDLGYVLYSISVSHLTPRVVKSS